MPTEGKKSTPLMPGDLDDDPTGDACPECGDPTLMEDQICDECTDDLGIAPSNYPERDLGLAQTRPGRARACSRAGDGLHLLDVVVEELRDPQSREVVDHDLQVGHVQSPVRPIRSRARSGAREHDAGEEPRRGRLHQAYVLSARSPTELW